MAAGFRRGEMKSMAGRTIKPTSRVRDILSTSLCVAYEQAQEVVRDGERKIRAMMAANRTVQEVAADFVCQEQNRDEVRDLLDQLKERIDRQDFDTYCEKFASLSKQCDTLEQDVRRYEPRRASSEGSRRRPSLVEMRQRNRALESELQELQSEYVRTMMISGDDATGKPVSSTPRSPAPNEPRGRVTFDQSGAPSSIGNKPTLEVQEEPAKVTIDPTTQAIERLATILEGRASGGPGAGRLPRVEPDVFKGELTAFPAWWNSFETMVETRAKTENERLFYLSKFTSGPAYESIKGFLSLYGDDTAYRKARNVIISRYGNRLKIAEAFKERLNKWPTVKEGDGGALQAYADFLWQCHSAMNSLDYLSNLGCQEENLKMAAKLPRQVGERWDRVVDDAVFGEEPDMTSEPSGLVGRFPSYQEFCRFVSREARIMVGTCTKTVPAAAPRARRGATSLHVSAGEKAATKPATAPPARKPASSTTKCEYCAGDHPLYQCEKFLGRAVEFKRDYARERGMCFGCLKTNHTFRTCRIRNPDIMRDHVDPPDQQPPHTASTLHVTAGEEGNVYSSTIVPVLCCFDENPENKILVYAMLDTQSSGCFVTEDLISQLYLDPEQVDLELTTLGSKRLVKCGVIQGLRVKAERGTQSIELPRCYTRRRLPGDYRHIPEPNLVARWAHLRDVSAELAPVRPDIPFGLLIGFNCGEAFCQEDYRRAERSQPFAIKTVLGWSVSGLLAEKRSPMCRCCWGFCTRVNEATSEEVRLAFDQGFEGEQAAEGRVSQDDAKFARILAEGMKQNNDGHFEVPLPFRETPTDLPDSRPMALQRLMSVQRRMRRDPEYQRQYAEFMNKVVDSGQATPVKSNDDVPVGSRWYWCHHSVAHPRKPGQTRGVWDGKAEVKGVSINSRLIPGPDQMNNLVGVLARFRQERVAVTCDIEGMFLQVGVAPQHRQYLRFLWFAGGDPDAAIVEYEMNVLPFGASSSPAIAGSVLKETADRFEGQFGERAAQFVRDHFYVDDGLGSEPDDDRAVALIRNSRALCAAGGFNLRKFASSSRAVMEAVPKEWLVRSLQELQIQKEHLPNERILGLLMSLQDDVFLYRVVLAIKADTRRGYLSALSSIFDPIGLVAPALLPGRLLLQRLCSSKFTWDQEVEEDMKLEWGAWYVQLKTLEKLAVPRCYRLTAELPLSRTEMHVFTDASTRGYGACCYILLQDEQGRCDTSLVFAKSRVAPAKHTTVPRLELQAAVLGVRMGAFAAAELRYPSLQCHYWTDSTVTLGYITNESRRFHVYVANRSRFIREHTDADQWHHIATDQNPADIASRGATSEELVSSDLWWRGPRDVMQESAPKIGEIAVDESDPELRKTVQVLAADLHEEPGLCRVVLERISRWCRCVAVMARCLQFVQRLRARVSERRELSPVELQHKAERLLISSAQREVYAEEISLLERREYPQSRGMVRDRKTRLKLASNLYRLDVYVDGEGMLRVGGRLQLSSWPRDMVHPLVVPGGHPVARRLIAAYHEKGGHMGSVTTTNTLRQAGFWITGGRASVTSVVAGCLSCKRKRGVVVEQRMADLPPDRLETGPPFTHVAADMFGPLLVKRGRAVEKWWICVFVCMSSRAVHLEPVNSMDISGFIQAYRRFVARRGPVRSLRCDRGTNFVGADGEQHAALREMDEKLLTQELARRSCDMIPFRFNYPKASHMAGSWERMIRSVRSAFWTTIRKHGESMYLDVLTTMVAEAEWLVNSRPITVVDMKDDTTPRALTPAQLLTMKPEVLAPPPGDFGPEERYARRRWRLTQHLADQFWRRWVREYALCQQARQQWQRATPNLEIGDIVLLSDAAAPRGSWPLARVVATEPSSDGLVRKVTVRTAVSTLQRPVQKVVFLHREQRSDA